MGEFSAREIPVWDGGQGLLGKAGCLRTSPYVFVTCLSFSALHHAALNGNTELITLLLEAQAAVDIKDNKGKACQGPQSQGLGLSPARGLDGSSVEVSTQGLSLGLGRSS